MAGKFVDIQVGIRPQSYLVNRIRRSGTAESIEFEDFAGIKHFTLCNGRLATSLGVVSIKMKMEFEAVELQIPVKVNLSVHIVSSLTVVNISHFLIDLLFNKYNIGNEL